MSTIEQVGAESQTRALLKYCEHQGIRNYEVFTDHGISRAKESRPALKTWRSRSKESSRGHWPPLFSASLNNECAKMPGAIELPGIFFRFNLPGALHQVVIADRIATLNRFHLLAIVEELA